MELFVPNKNKTANLFKMVEIWSKFSKSLENIFVQITLENRVLQNI
jgi:hypothetical protein